METKGGEPRPIEGEIYGQTGEKDIDGLLTPEQRVLLNTIQQKSAKLSFDYVTKMGKGDPFPMTAMATGIGKGNIIHRLIERQINHKKDSKILVVAGTKLVLVKQTHEALSGYQKAGQDAFEYIESEDKETGNGEGQVEENPLEDEKSTLYKTGKLGDANANVHVAVIQNVQSKIKRGILNPDDYDLVIVDEVHNVGTEPRKAVIQAFKKVVGFTATPYRNSGRLKDPEQYGFKAIESLPLPSAQRLRLLPPLLGIQIDTKSVVDEIPTTMTGTIDFKKLEILLKQSPELRPYIADRVAKVIRDGERKYKTVIAVNFVWEAEELAKLLKEKGIKVGIAVNQQASKQIHTDEIPAIGSIERYKLPENDFNSIQVLISPYVASEGFDAPATEVLVWASPTDSNLRYTQYSGRLARRNNGKLFGLIIDCLYQTSQYGWAKNMGMWMKGDVQQLENGMLWLGPETDIEDLKKLPQVEAIREKADVKDISDLQKEGLLKVQETDFPLSQISLRSTFIGGDRRIQPLVKKVVELIRRENPDLITSRISGTNVVEAIRERQIFIEKMLELGARLKESNVLNLQKTDFPITNIYLTSTFVGDNIRLYSLAQEVLEQIRKENPELVAKRRNQTRYLDVVTDREMFIAAMLKKGVALRMTEVKGMQETDFPITQDNLIATFLGDYRTHSPIAKKVLKGIRNSDPELVVERRSGSRYFTVLTDRHKFIEQMVKRGCILRPLEIEKVRETDFPITKESLIDTFVAAYRKKLKAIIEEVLGDLRKEGPKLVVKRSSGKHIIEVVTDRKRFIDEMVKRGVKLREK